MTGWPAAPELVRNIYACLIAQTTNLGLAGMAEAYGIPCPRRAPGPR